MESIVEQERQELLEIARKCDDAVHLGNALGSVGWDGRQWPSSPLGELLKRIDPLPVALVMEMEHCLSFEPSRTHAYGLQPVHELNV